jgi:NAD(P)-dependent dehydrogenase (short-subunit alcohol dehydrogenase family)
VTADISFAGRVVVISGAGKGMGREHALLLASRGAAIVVDDIDAPAADEVTTLIRDRGGKAVASHETVATRAGGQAIIQTAIDEFGTVDVVVHNAGYVDFENFEDLTEAQITKMVNTHLLGGYWLTQPAWPIMKAKNYGRVVLVSSGSGIMGHHGLADYCGAKAGLYGLMTALAFEGEPFGIRTNAIFPTASTTIMDETFAKIPEFQKWSFGESFEPYSDLMNQTPRFLPTVASPMVAYLSSEECAVNGECFSTTAARFARTFFGVANGWVVTDFDSLSPESIRSHLPQIRALENYSIHMTVMDFIKENAEMMRSDAQ